jgi:hypothetical protein
LGNLNFEIAVCVFRFGLPSVEFLESHYESINALRVVLHFHPNVPAFRKEIIIPPVARLAHTGKIGFGTAFGRVK